MRAMPGVIPYQTATLKNVELIEVGNHRGELYTLADLKDMARNFVLAIGYVDPALVLGHEEEQALLAEMTGGTPWSAALADAGLPDVPFERALEDQGMPAAGWMTSARVTRRRGKDGKTRWVLLSDWHGVHPTIAGLINRRYYRKISPEVYDDPPEGAPPACRGKMIRRAALLGATPPHIKGLADVPFAQFGERRASLRFSGGRVRTADGKAWRVFSEVTPMDRATLEDQLKTLGWSDAMIEACKSLQDDAFAALANAALAQAAGADTGNGAATDTGAATGMVEWPPEAPSRDEVIAQLVAAGQDEAALQAMTDEELLAKWQEVKGGVAGAAPMSEKNKAGATAFAESLKRSILADVRRELAGAKTETAALRADAERRRKAERQGAVKAYCERWLREGYVLPAEVDAASKAPNLHHRLMNADGTRVRKYGEGPALSDFDAAVAEIEARGPGWARRNTREIIPDPEADKKKSLFDRVREEAKAKKQPSGPTLEQRLHMAPRNGNR